MSLLENSRLKISVSSLNLIQHSLIKDHKDLPAGVIYFGDDDNTYDLKLFEEIRFTKKVSMFPVGLLGPQGLSSPIVKHSKVIGQGALE